MDRSANVAEHTIGIGAVVAHCSDFPRGFATSPHRHQRCQFIYSSAGVMMLTSDEGAWIVPPDRAVWIPAGALHDARMISPVSTMTVWIEPDPAIRMPKKCQVVNVSPLMRQLLMEAVKITPESSADTRTRLITALLLNELEVLPGLPFRLPFPKNPQLANRCQSFFRNPTPHETIDEWSAALCMSRRTFTRLFRAETGLSFSAWRQQACLLAALPRLAAGESITTVAIDLGYNSPAAFTTMFKRLQGVPPSRCLT
jgi:AraC-like DNA-binding protein